MITGLVSAVLFTVTFIIRSAHTSYSDLSHPHRALYHKADSAQPQELTAVVQPLIDEKQRFDIFATIWLRVPSKNLDGDTDLTEEIVIFEDTVFKGVGLKDKTHHSIINYRIPTATFERRNISNHDLRASIVLIPQSPSLLDYASNYTTWIPDGVIKPPSRSYDISAPRTLRDEILDSFAISVPLLNFHRISGVCSIELGGQGSQNLDDDDEEEEEANDDKNAEPGMEKMRTAENYVVEAEYKSTEDLPVLKSHPYVITR